MPGSKKRFQFLIGSLKTLRLTKNLCWTSLFQFLIGSLKTGGNGACYITYWKVSIPHRQSKNCSCIVLLPTVFIVSIPHRQSKNVPRKFSIRLPNWVSIPHRQSKNVDYYQYACSLFRMFQFLIGSLKTMCGRHLHRAIHQFQFLIGSLKTLAGSTSTFGKEVFQFLIGSLKTNY